MVIFGATVIAALGARSSRTRRPQLSVLADVIRCIGIIWRGDDDGRGDPDLDSNEPVGHQ